LKVYISFNRFVRPKSIAGYLSMNPLISIFPVVLSSFTRDSPISALDYKADGFSAGLIPKVSGTPSFSRYLRLASTDLQF